LSERGNTGTLANMEITESTEPVRFTVL